MATKITVAALAALSPEQIKALGQIEVVDTASKQASKQVDRALVSDDAIIEAATGYTDKGKYTRRLDDGSATLTRLDATHGVVIGASNGQTRVVRYSTAANGRVYASTVGTYSDDQLVTLAQSLMAATNQASTAPRKSDTATALAALAAASRRSHVIDVLKAQGIAIPADVNKMKVSDFRAWAIEAVAAR